ncbi:MAG: SUMF1/EgtB/PvdO family nonheme iron enzyme [Chloroflexota bacterium]
MNYALLIGNTNYDNPALKKLKAPAADVENLSAVLRDPVVGGYEAQTLVDKPFAVVRNAITKLFKGKTKSDLLLLYFSGHGVLDDNNRLCLAVRDTDPDLPLDAGIDSPWLTHVMNGNSPSQPQVLILDCCYADAFNEGRKGEQVVSPDTFEVQGRGRVVLTSTNRFSPAWEGNKFIRGLETSLFTHYLIEGIQTGAAADASGNVTADGLFTYVFKWVTEAAPNQKPGRYVDQGGQIIIAHARPAPKRKLLPPELLEDLINPRAYVREGAVIELGRLLRGNDSALARAARDKLEELRADDSLPKRVYDAVERVLEVETQPAPMPASTSPSAPASRPPADWISITHPFALALRRIPAGEFLMGSDKAKDSDAFDDELPQHKPFVSEYLIAKTPITVAQWAAFAQATKHKTTAEQKGSGWVWNSKDGEWEEIKGAWWQAPRGPGSDVKSKQGHPVTQISWDDAVAFCNWLNTTAALKSLPASWRFRLPTEAEWEKAARGTDGRIYPWGDAKPDETYCNFYPDIGDTTPVGQYSPKGDSPFGLQDMAGNVWEWCWDGWDEQAYDDDPFITHDVDTEKHVVRGGAFVNESWRVRCACRGWDDTDFRDVVSGMRVCASPVLLSL